MEDHRNYEKQSLVLFRMVCCPYCPESLIRQKDPEHIYICTYCKKAFAAPPQTSEVSRD